MVINRINSQLTISALFYAHCVHSFLMGGGAGVGGFCECTRFERVEDYFIMFMLPVL